MGTEIDCSTTLDLKSINKVVDGKRYKEGERERGTEKTNGLSGVAVVAQSPESWISGILPSMWKIFMIFYTFYAVKMEIETCSFFTILVTIIFYLIWRDLWKVWNASGDH